MSDVQKEHASTVEHLAPSLAALRLKLQSYMSEEQFWIIYFILLLPRLSEHDFELLSTSEARVFFLYVILCFFSIAFACIINSNIICYWQTHGQIDNGPGNDLMQCCLAFQCKIMPIRCKHRTIGNVFSAIYSDN